MKGKPQLNDLEHSSQIEKPLCEKKLAGLSQQTAAHPTFANNNAGRLLSI